MGGRRDGRVVCEVWVVKPRFYKDEVFKVGGRMDIRGVYRVSSLMKQNKKGKNYAVFCFAGKRKLLFYILRCDYMGNFL